MGKIMAELNIRDGETTGEDWDRVGGALTAFTKSKGGPDYSPLNVTFNAIAPAGEVVASAVITRNQGMCTVDLVYVEQGERGQGYGSKLLCHIEHFAKAHGDVSIFLTSPTWQAGGTGFYEGHGYTELGRLPKWSSQLEGQQFEVFYGKEL